MKTLATTQKTISISLDENSLQVLDKLRGKTSRSAFIRILIHKLSVDSISEAELESLLQEFTRKMMDNHTKLITLMQGFKNE